MYAKSLLSHQHGRIVSLVHGRALMQSKTTNTKDIAAACKWLSAATSVASSATIPCDFVSFFAESLASGTCSWLHVISCCDPASFKASIASMYKSAASASKCSPPNAFSEMFRCLAHLLMAKAGKGSDVDALALCYKTVARAPAHLASRTIGSMAVSLLPPSNGSALSGTVCMLLTALAKKSNAPSDLEILLHNFSGDKALGTLLSLLISSRGHPAPTPSYLSSAYSLLPPSLTPEWSSALAQCVQYSSEFWPEVTSIFGGKAVAVASGPYVLNSSTLLSLPSLALQLMSSNQHQEARRMLECHSQVLPLLSHLLSTKPYDGIKVAKKWLSALRLSDCGIETCWNIAGASLEAVLKAAGEDDIASVWSEMPRVSEEQQSHLLQAIAQVSPVAAADTLGVICLLFQTGCIKSLLFDCVEDQPSTALSRATFSLLARKQIAPFVSGSCDGVLGKLGRDWADFQIFRNTSAYVENSGDMDHELMKRMLDQQFLIAPTFHRIFLLLSYVDLLVSAGNCLEARSIIKTLLPCTSFWSSKFICKDVLNCLSSCIRSLHLNGFFSIASSLAEDFHSIAPDQLSKFRSFMPSKLDRTDSLFSFVSSDAAACESLRAFMNGNLQKAVHLSSFAVKLASGSKNNSSPSDVKSQDLQELSTLRQRYRILSCCFLACTMASHSCLSVESQYYMKTASTLIDSMQLLPRFIRQHIEIGKKSCAVSMLKFHSSHSVAAQDAISASRESNFCLSFEIVYHRMLRFGTSEVAEMLAVASLFNIDKENAFSVAVSSLSILLTEIKSGTNPRVALEHNRGACTPLLCDAVLQWCSESLKPSDRVATNSNSVTSQSLLELESLTAVQLRSKASELGLTVPSKAKKADVAKLIYDYESRREDKNVGNHCGHAVILDALECVWSLSASTGSPSTVRNVASLISPQISSSSPSIAAFAVLSATGVRARHIVDELMKSDSSPSNGSDAWWHDANALRVLDTFQRGCSSVMSSSGWESIVLESTSCSFTCSISVYSNSVTVTRSSSKGGSISYTQQNEAGFSIEDLESLHLDSPVAEVPVESFVESSLWNAWGIFSSLGKEMESIIDASDRTLGSSSSAKTVFEKKQWWADRDEADRRLQVLCCRLQRLIGPVALSILIPPIQDETFTHRIQNLAFQNQDRLRPEVLESMMHAAPIIGFDALEPYADVACIDALRLLWTDSSHLDLGRLSAVLVLPPPLHHFPWESMPALRNCSISRMICPSVCFAAAAAHPKSVDTRNAYYVINPGGDLADTQNFFEPWFSSVPGWSGCAGSTPPASEALERISQSHLFM